MKITLADKFIAWLTLVCGLSLSAVAIYYSVAGLVSIFAAAVVPIVIMGAVLEISKLVATVWLKQNWFIAPRAIKAYLLSAVAVLMFITSMGIFGYLSKAHTDQSLVSGDVMSKISIYDEKIKTEKENIDVARKAIKQLDEAVDQVMARSSDERGADKASQIRRAQQRERAALQRDINNAQSNISKLQTERAPIAAEVRKVEAEVGPIKYIAKLIYGDNPDQNLLEKAVTWVIIMIVIVFDPLAVIMLLASQYSFQWFRNREPEEENLFYVADVGEKPTTEELHDDLFPTYEEITPKTEKKFTDAGEHPRDTFEHEQEEIAEGDSPEKESDIVSTATVTEHRPETHPYLQQGFAYPADWVFHPPIVAKIEESTIDNKVEQDFDESTELSDEEKEARRRWKEEHPDSTIKQQEYLKDVGRIDKLPWEDESKKKSKYIIREDNQQVKKTKD